MVNPTHGPSTSPMAHRLALDARLVLPRSATHPQPRKRNLELLERRQAHLLFVGNDPTFDPCTGLKLPYLESSIAYVDQPGPANADARIVRKLLGPIVACVGGRQYLTD